MVPVRFSLFLLAAGLALAGTLPKAAPEDVGLSSDRLQRIRVMLQGYIDRGEIAGAVSLVARKGRVAWLEAQGFADLEQRTPLRADHIFRLASMTKPITSTAVLMLHEEGRFLLDDPIAKFLPEFQNMQVAVANAPNERAGAGYRLEPARRPITIRHLLTHTAGLASGTAGPTVALAKAHGEKRTAQTLLADHIRELAKLPLNFHPGDHWEYGPATDVLGRLVEVVSGQTLDEFFRRRILMPLAMNDTWFYLPGNRLPRLVTAYEPKDGRIVKRVANPVGPETRDGKYLSGGGGLAGTAEDYLRFCQLLLQNGQLDGTRLLSRKSVEAMTVNQIGALPLWQDAYRNYTFGLGVRVRQELGQTQTLGSPGEYGWGGAYGTYFWIDPKEQMIGILMIQLMPYAHLNIRPEFQNAATQAIID